MRSSFSSGFSLIELMIALAILAIVGSLGMNTYTDYVLSANINKAIHEIRAAELLILDYRLSNRRNPADLAEIGFDLTDPWGTEYQFYDVETGNRVRKDRNLTPINSDFDLYSMGPDGRTALPLTARNSRDDIVRANNGKYVGLAEGY